MEYFNVNAIKENKFLECFVNRSLLTIPGSSAIDGKMFKKQNKLQHLISKVGFYGPILDLCIRGSINHILIYEFNKDVKKITQIQSGALYNLLRKHFVTDDVLWGAIQAWFSYEKVVYDYEVALRNFRSDLVNQWLSTILTRPSNRVSTTCMFTIQIISFLSNMINLGVQFIGSVFI
jgi:hypothetical protein